MKKSFKFYAIGWLLLFCLFNVLSFVVPAWPTLEKFTPSFWIGWGVTVAAFLGQLVCARFVFKEDSAKKTFYNVALFKVSYYGLIATFVVSIICMVAAPLPYWIAAIACALVLVFNAFAIIKAKIVVDTVAAVDEKIEKATSFIYDMREESESLLARAKTDATKAICKKVRDAFKFSDPMSNTQLEPAEAEIKTHFDLLKNAVAEGNVEVVTAESEELLVLIAERNNKCKRLK